jgi:hypothetical protein
MSHRSKPPKKMPSLKAMMKRQRRPSYEQGVDVVPETGPATVHKGERIIPADENPLNLSKKELEQGKAARNSTQIRPGTSDRGRLSSTQGFMSNTE